MPVEVKHLRRMAEALTGEAANTIQQAAREIELLRKQLYEAHASNADSERLDWLSDQAHHEYCHPACRVYFRLPRILTRRKNGVTAVTLREAIDLVRKPPRHDF
jgi:hypothetical protein